MYVQYIIKNESDKSLKAKLAVESNICDLNFLTDKKNYLFWAINTKLFFQSIPAIF